jgi:hypothetical protein
VVNVSIFATGTVSSITYNGVNLAFVRADATGVYRNEMWVLPNPAYGSHTITVNLSTSLTSIASASSYGNVNPDMVEASAGATGSGVSTPSVALTTITNYAWVVNGLTTSDATMTPAGSQTARDNNTGALGTGALGDTGPVTPTGSVTSSWSAVTITDSWAIGAIALDPAFESFTTSITQVAASLTFTGGTQVAATINDVSITQVGATLTLTGGTQISQSNSSNTQTTATLTFTGGTQSVATVNDVAIAQSGATLTLSGGTQGSASIQDVSISQVGGTVTLTGGTQLVASIQDVQLSQVGATITLTGGVQTAKTNSTIAQSSATLTLTGGTQSLTALIDAAIAQRAATILFSGGSQSIFLPPVWNFITTIIGSVVQTGVTNDNPTQNMNTSATMDNIGSILTNIQENGERNNQNLNSIKTNIYIEG